MSRFRHIALALLLIGTVAACSSSPGASATVEPTPTEEPTPTPTEEEAGSEPTLEPGAGDLAAILPTEVGGITLEYQSTTGAAVLGSDAMTPETLAFFDRVGANPADLSSAFGFGFDAEAGSGISIVAFRVPGADEGELRDEFRAVMDAEEDTTITEDTVGGKNVLAFTTTAETADGYIYVKGDIIFIVGGEPAELVEEALTGLP